MVECCENPRKHHSAIFDKYNDKRFKRASHFVETEMRRGFQVLDILAGSGSYPELYEPKKSWSHKWKTVSLISKFSPQARPWNIFIIQRHHITACQPVTIAQNRVRCNQCLQSLEYTPSASDCYLFYVQLLAKLELSIPSFSLTYIHYPKHSVASILFHEV